MSSTKKARRPDRDSTAAEAVTGNEDLITEILVRLPPRCLHRFKRVCRQWRSLISSPPFCRKLTSRDPNPRPSGLFFYNLCQKGYGWLRFVSFDDRRWDGVRVRAPCVFRDVVLLQSCNGLILCSSSQELEKAETKFFVCNPCIKKCVMIPRPEERAEESIVRVSLAFDPAKSIHYKVLCLWRVENSNTFGVEVYSSETGGWKSTARKSFIPKGSKIELFEQGVFWDSVVHWAAWDHCGLYFDIESEDFDELETPLGVIRYMGACQGRLYVINWILSIGLNHIIVFEMKKDHSDWLERCHLDIGDLGYDSYSILSLIRGEGDEDLTLVMAVPGKLIAYNIKDKTIKVLYNRLHKNVYSGCRWYIGDSWCYACQYVECHFCI